MIGTLHARCDCRTCARARITMCGLPMDQARREGRRPRHWCPVCADLLGLWLATDECPRVTA